MQESYFDPTKVMAFDTLMTCVDLPEPGDQLFESLMVTMGVSSVSKGIAATAEVIELLLDGGWATIDPGGLKTADIRTMSERAGQGYLAVLHELMGFDIQATESGRGLVHEADAILRAGLSSALSHGSCDTAKVAEVACQAYLRTFEPSRCAGAYVEFKDDRLSFSIIHWALFTMTLMDVAMIDRNDSGGSWVALTEEALGSFDGLSSTGRFVRPAEFPDTLLFRKIH